MTIEELKKLQVGNAIYIAGMVAFVDTIFRENVDGKWIMFYGGHYRCFEDLSGKECLAWLISDDEEYNKERHLMSLENFEGIPIPEDFEELNHVNMWNDPKAVENYQFVHCYQNEWNRYEHYKNDWIINAKDKEE